MSAEGKRVTIGFDICSKLLDKKKRMHRTEGLTNFIEWICDNFADDRYEIIGQLSEKRKRKRR
jgi:hypothetical protein